MPCTLPRSGTSWSALRGALMRSGWTPKLMAEKRVKRTNNSTGALKGRIHTPRRIGYFELSCVFELTYYTAQSSLINPAALKVVWGEKHLRASWTLRVDGKSQNI